MIFGWEPQALGLVNFLITLGVITVLFGLLLMIFLKVIRRTSGYIFIGIFYTLFVLCLIFYLIPALIGIATFFSACLATFFFANLGDLRAFIANPFKRTSAKSANFGVEKIYDREALYAQIESAVLQLSKTRTGALITFEKNTSLREIMKNGVPIHAPVSSELLVTIFYPGTRLHDGAVVVHGNEIIAASVFFTPTTKPFAGKYGSRHRAAIGVSEVSDSVTVVVSEETGRISIATNGELNRVDQSNFLRSFETYMADSEPEE